MYGCLLATHLPRILPHFAIHLLTGVQAQDGNYGIRIMAMVFLLDLGHKQHLGKMQNMDLLI